MEQNQKSVKELRKTSTDLYNKFSAIKDEYRFAVEQTIRAIVEKYNGKIDLTENDDFQDEYRDCLGSVCVTYDGGNHPEYASNAFSELTGVRIEDGEVYLEIEESDTYDICRVWNIDEISAVCDALEFYDDFMEEGKNPDKENEE